MLFVKIMSIITIFLLLVMATFVIIVMFLMMKEDGMLDPVIELFEGMFWTPFDKKKPKVNGWYQCTVEVPNQQRYVMDLYWYNEKQMFRDNRIQHTFDTYEVLNYKGEHMHFNNLCNRTSDVVAWRKMPKTYMRGFKEEG